jgi:ATP-binding cassette subfamily B protein
MQPFDLDLRRSPRRQRRAFLATRDVAPQRFAAAIERDAEHLAKGTTARASGRSLGRSLISDLRAIWVRVVAFGILARFALLAAVWISGRIFVDEGPLGDALAVAGGYLVFQLAGALCTYASDVGRGQLAVAVELYLTTVINRKLLRLAPDAASGTTGKLKNLVSSDVQYYSDFISSLTWNLTPALASVVVLGPAVYVLAGLPGLIGIGTAFLNVPIAVLLSRTLERQQSAKQEHLDRIATLIGEWLRNVRLSRYLGWQAALQSEVAALLRKYMRAYVRRHALLCLTFGISFSWWMVPVVAILASSSWLGRPVDLKGFFTTLWIIKDMSEYLQHLPHAINLHSSAVVCLRRIEELGAAKELEAAFRPIPAGATPIAPGARPVRLDLDGVSVAYGERTALRPLTATLDLEHRTAVVGAVGAGKTTLIRVLCGDLPPTAGAVRVTFSDGSSGDLWERSVYAAYRAGIGYVPQEPFISSSTLAANVALADRAAAGDAALVDAAYRAELESDVRGLRRGFEEPIGETGVNLSGGQKQRVNIARALYAKRPALLLDDPLSAVDARTEAALMTNLIAASRGFVLVTHRLAELGRVDRVLVLDDGALIEDGAPDALGRDAASAYSRLAHASTAHASDRTGLDGGDHARA